MNGPNKCPDCCSLNIRDRAVIEDELPAGKHWRCGSCGFMWDHSE